jgi:tRNA nucleotidyltransferase (CCA-adding enzyme)
VTTYRLDGEYEDHRHPKEVVFTPNLEEDLKRRDFTINAMAYNERTGIVDLYEGQKDLEAGVIRAVGVPRERFEEDALRMLRAIRFAGQLGFQIEQHTKEAIVELARTLCHVSAERIQVEMKKLLVSKNPYLLATAEDVGLCDVFFPEFIQMMDTEQNNPHHCYCVGMHTLHAVEEVNKLTKDLEGKQRTILAFAALLHDVGKPQVKTTDEEGIDHFYEHEVMGTEMARKILHRWKMDNETINYVSRMIRNHDRRYEGGEKGMRRAMSKVGEDIMPMLFMLQEADLRAQSEYKRQEKLTKLEQAKLRYREVLEKGQAVCIKDLKIDGNDLIQLGVQKGPEIGKYLNLLLQYVLDQPEKNEKAILEIKAKELMKEENECL